LPLAAPILQTTLAERRPNRQGKVRDIYEFGDRLLIVASDRISAFDYVLGSGIPDKGKILSQISAFWFERTASIVANHLLSTDPASFPGEARRAADVLSGRSMLVRRAEPLPIECVARGYLSGSGWKDYVATGEVCGVKLPAGLTESDKLDEPIFTPATKAETGHDMNVSEAAMSRSIGEETTSKLKNLTLTLYRRAAEYADSRGIIIADTKFEFGLKDGNIILIDEVLTPDSSRFWPKESYQPGRGQQSFDKQYLRDYLETVEWNKQPPGPNLPETVVARTSEKYLEAYRLLTGRTITDSGIRSQESGFGASSS